MNVLRRIRRRNEVSYWAPLDRRNRIFLMSEAGTITGLGELPTSRNLSVKPFSLASRSSGTSLANGNSEVDGGIDMKWGITPNMTMDLTWRTDFSQVEVDQEQVNLTRFPLFFRSCVSSSSRTRGPSSLEMSREGRADHASGRRFGT